MQELIEQFGINWKLLIAQIINFGILFVVLKKFAYKPILDMLKERQDKISEGLNMHAKAKIELESAEQEKARLIGEGNIQARNLVQKAKSSAEEIEMHAVAETEVKVANIISNAHKEIEKDRNAMLEGVYSESSEVIKEALKKILEKDQLEDTTRNLIKQASQELKKLKQNVQA